MTRHAARPWSMGCPCAAGHDGVPNRWRRVRTRSSVAMKVGAAQGERAGPGAVVWKRWWSSARQTHRARRRHRPTRVAVAWRGPPGMGNMKSITSPSARSRKAGHEDGGARQVELLGDVVVPARAGSGSKPPVGVEQGARQIAGRVEPGATEQADGAVGRDERVCRSPIRPWSLMSGSSAMTTSCRSQVAAHSPRKVIR